MVGVIAFDASTASAVVPNAVHAPARCWQRVRRPSAACVRAALSIGVACLVVGALAWALAGGALGALASYATRAGALGHAAVVLALVLAAAPVGYGYSFLIAACGCVG